MQINKWTSNNEDETIQMGKNFAQLLELNDIVFLEGELGAGKTEFIKGICQYFKVDDLVTSPTFSIINQYSASKNNHHFNIFHIDLYRIKNQEELFEVGIIELLNDVNSILLIEWPKNGSAFLTSYNYLVQILTSNDNENIREIIIDKVIL